MEVADLMIACYGNCFGTTVPPNKRNDLFVFVVESGSMGLTVREMFVKLTWFR